MPPEAPLALRLDSPDAAPKLLRSLRLLLRSLGFFSEVGGWRFLLRSFGCFSDVCLNVFSFIPLNNNFLIEEDGYVRLSGLGYWQLNTA